MTELRGSATANVAAAAQAGARTRHPVHLAVMAGTAVGIYAVSLAGVTALQAATNADLAAQRDPVAAAIAQQRAGHDRMDAALTAAADGYAEAAAAYADILETLAGHEGDLAALEQAIARAEGSAAKLAVPARPALPTIRSTVTTRVVTRPAVNASTGASGGG